MVDRGPLKDDRYDGQAGVYERLPHASDVPGPAKSIQGWVIIVRGVNELAQEDDLIEEFNESGEIINLHLNLDRRTGFVKGYAFIEYGTKLEAETAIRTMDGQVLLEQRLAVDWAFRQPSRRPRSSHTSQRHPASSHDEHMSGDTAPRVSGEFGTSSNIAPPPPVSQTPGGSPVVQASSIIASQLPDSRIDAAGDAVLSGIRVRGVTVTDLPESTLFSVLALVKDDIVKDLVKEEPIERIGNICHSGTRPHRVDSQQRQLMRHMMRSASRFDPAQDPSALGRWSHLLEDLDVSLLRQTHDCIGSRFAHGPHKGERVMALVPKLEAGLPTKRVTPLVVAKCIAKFWVVFGNRRLKALKEYAALVYPRKVQMHCIVHDLDASQQVDKALLAKFLHSATTENGGLSACFREPLRSSHGAGVSSRCSIHTGRGPKCFLVDTVLQDLHGRYVHARDLEEDSYVRSAEGVPVRVVSNRLHHAEVRTLVDLRTDTASLVVTSTHRVMVYRGNLQSAPADSLRVGDDVECSNGGRQSLHYVQKFSAQVEVCEIRFHPDVPVAAFVPPRDMILTKGHGHPRTRRRQGNRDCANDETSLPDTASLW